MVNISDCKTIFLYIVHNNIRINVIPPPPQPAFPSTYPLTPPVYSDRGYVKYRIALVSDLDTNSKHPTEKNTWISYLKKVSLVLVYTLCVCVCVQYI